VTLFFPDIFPFHSCIVSWQEPEHVFREGNPQPDAELKFWQNRVENSDMKRFRIKRRSDLLLFCFDLHAFFDEDFSTIEGRI